MWRLGPEALTDAEVLAILLGTGSSEEPVMALSQRLLGYSMNQYGSPLGFIKSASLEELTSMCGIGPVKASRLKAAAELARRFEQRDLNGHVTVHRARDVYDIVKQDIEDKDREHFCVVMLNVRNQVIGREVISVGTLDMSVVHPRELFKSCIKRSAAAVILVHNHPSGDPNPSDDDIEVTKRLVEAGKVLGIHVLDHIVVGKGSFCSVREITNGLVQW